MSDDKPWLRAKTAGEVHRIAHSWWLTHLWTTHDCHEFIGAAFLAWHEARGTMKEEFQVWEGQDIGIPCLKIHRGFKTLEAALGFIRQQGPPHDGFRLVWIPAREET